MSCKSDNRFDFSFYLDSIYSIVLLSIGVLFTNYLFGNGILGEETNEDTNSVYTFDTIFILYLLVYLGIGALIFLLIFTKLKSIEIRLIYGTVLGISGFYLESEVLNALSSNTSINNYKEILLYSVLIISPIFFIRFVYVYATGMASIKIRNFGIITSSIIFGRFITLYFDLITLVYFSIILALFDIWNVFKGPIAKIIGKPTRNIVKNTKNQFRGPDLNQIKDICLKGTPVLISKKYHTLIGIGDLFFFVLLIYRAYIEWNMVGYFLTIITVITGNILTLVLLQRISPLPGLPIPVMSTLLGYLILSIYT